MGFNCLKARATSRRQFTFYFLTTFYHSPYHKPVSAVTSKRRRSSLSRKNPFSGFGRIIPFRKTQFKLSLCMSLVFGASRNVSFNDENHILKFFTKGFENLPSSFLFNSENLLSRIGQCMWLHLYFPFGKFHLDIHNKMTIMVLLFHMKQILILVRTFFVEFIYLSGNLKTINCHINLLHYYLKERSVLPVSAIICRPDFLCFNQHTPLHFYGIAWVFLSW